MPEGARPLTVLLLWQGDEADQQRARLRDCIVQQMPTVTVRMLDTFRHEKPEGPLWLGELEKFVQESDAVIALNSADGRPCSAAGNLWFELGYWWAAKPHTGSSPAGMGRSTLVIHLQGRDQGRLARLLKLVRFRGGRPGHGDRATPANINNIRANTDLVSYLLQIDVTSGTNRAPTVEDATAEMETIRAFLEECRSAIGNRDWQNPYPQGALPLRERARTALVPHRKDTQLDRLFKIDPVEDPQHYRHASLAYLAELMQLRQASLQCDRAADRLEAVGRSIESVKKALDYDNDVPTPVRARVRESLEQVSSTVAWSFLPQSAAADEWGRFVGGLRCLLDFERKRRLETCPTATSIDDLEEWGRQRLQAREGTEFEHEDLEYYAETAQHASATLRRLSQLTAERINDYMSDQLKPDHNGANGSTSSTFTRLARNFPHNHFGSPEQDDGDSSATPRIWPTSEER